MKKNKTVFWFISILLLATFVRLWQLDRVPVALSNDEVGFIYSAYSIWKTGKDVTGKSFPLSFNLDNSFPPAIVYLLSPVVGILGPSVFSGRIMSVVFGVISVACIYFLVQFLLRNVTIALLAMIMLAVSPWHVFISRVVSAEISLSLFLIGTVLFLYGLKFRTLLWSIPSYTLSFHAYHATKIFFVLFVGIVCFVFRRELWKRKFQSAVFLVFIVLLYLTFFDIMKTQRVTRQQEITVLNMKRISQTVDKERDASLAPFWTRGVFSNKLTVFIKEFGYNYVSAFSPRLLFVAGEQSLVLNVGSHGFFYVAEIIFIPIGVWWLVVKAPVKSRRFILFSLLAGPVPAAVSGYETYAMRSVFLLPFLVITSACGLYAVWHFLRKHSVLKTVVALVYSYLIVSFFYLYFFRFPVYGAESYFYSMRKIQEMTLEKKHEYRQIIQSKSDPMSLLQYALYNRVEPFDIQNLWLSPWPKRHNSVTFTQDCFRKSDTYFDLDKDLLPSTLYITRPECHPYATPSAVITDPVEPLRTIWYIYSKE